MKCDKRVMRLYAVTDRAWTKNKSLYTQIREALDGGATCLQLREKNLNYDDLLNEAVKINELCKRYKVPFIVNDNVEIAVKSGADGVHIGQYDMDVREARKIIGDDKIIGVSVETAEQAVIAEKNGADYIGVGAMFPTSTKGDAYSISYDMLNKICKSVSIPVVAIGGITKENILKLKGSGVDGVAVVSAIFSADDITGTTRELKNLSMKLTDDIPRALTVAGSDCSGGAGIQADLKTMAAHNVYGMSVITALTAQNTTGVQGILNVSPEFVGNQLDSIFTDIKPDAVKIGMVSDKEIIKVIAERLNYYNARNIVLDPVMISTSGSKLINDDAIKTLKTGLMSLADIITPNVMEAEVLSGLEIKDNESIVAAAIEISKYYSGAILIKGGHIGEDASDMLYVDGESFWIKGERIENTNTHGTGCTLSSAIASNLAKGYSMLDSITNAKKYLTGAIAEKLDIGKGRGPLKHNYI